MTAAWEKEFRARQQALDAMRERVPASLGAAVLLWRKANRREDAPELGELLEWLLLHVARLESDLVDARAVCDGFARRIAGQSELLSKRAERVPDEPCAVCTHRLSRHTASGEGLCLDCDCAGWVRRPVKPPDDYRRKWLIALRRLILAEPERPVDAAARREEWGYAGGDCLCLICREKYADHAQDPGEPSLTILCDRSRVKL